MTARSKFTVFIFGAMLLMMVPMMAAQQAQPLTMTHGPNVEYIGPRSAEIAWTTNTGGSAVIHYGTDANNLNQTAQTAYDKQEGTSHVTHRVLIKNLNPGTTYYYVVDSAQGQGTGTEARGSVQTFTTKPEGQGSNAALTITDGPRIEYVGPNSAEIAWTTSTGGSSIIRYGTNPNSLTQTAQTPYMKGEGSHHVTHRVTVRNLQPNTTYYFIVDSGQGQGSGTEVKSQVSTFKTK